MISSRLSYDTNSQKVFLRSSDRGRPGQGELTFWSTVLHSHVILSAAEVALNSDLGRMVHRTKKCYCFVCNQMPDYLLLQL